MNSQQLNISDFSAFTEEEYLKNESLHMGSTSYDSVIDKFRKYSINPDNLYVAKKGLTHLWYMDEGVYIPIHSLFEPILARLQVGQLAKRRKELLKASLSDNNTEQYLEYIRIFSPEFLSEEERKVSNRAL